MYGKYFKEKGNNGLTIMAGHVTMKQMKNFVLRC